MSDTVHLAIDEVHALALRVLRHQGIIEADTVIMSIFVILDFLDCC